MLWYYHSKCWEFILQRNQCLPLESTWRLTSLSQLPSYTQEIWEGSRDRQTSWRSVPAWLCEGC